VRSLITEAVADERPMPNPGIQLANVTQSLKNQYFDRQIQTLTQAMSQPNLSKEELERIIRQQQELMFQRKADAVAALKAKRVG
jgi:hypothetical protein